MRTLGLALALALSCAGCTSYWLIGGNPHQGIPPGAATFSMGTCEDTRDHRTVASPTGKTYYTTTNDHGMVLLVIDNEGLSGDEITNHWGDREADHFFAYKEGGQAWHYLFRGDRSRPGAMLRYEPGSYTVKMVDGRMQPEGFAELRCVLSPQAM